jgi:hypothetical protein
MTTYLNPVIMDIEFNIASETKVRMQCLVCPALDHLSPKGRFCMIQVLVRIPRLIEAFVKLSSDRWSKYLLALPQRACIYFSLHSTNN